MAAKRHLAKQRQLAAGNKSCLKKRKNTTMTCDDVIGAAVVAAPTNFTELSSGVSTLIAKLVDSRPPKSTQTRGCETDRQQAWQAPQ